MYQNQVILDVLDLETDVLEQGYSGCTGTRSFQMYWNRVILDKQEQGHSRCSGTGSFQMYWNMVIPDVLEQGYSG